METKLNNWVENNKKFGLDYSTAKCKFGYYEFDIRYDYCGDATVKPKCGLVLTVRYRKNIIETKFRNSLEELKQLAEIILWNDVLEYYCTHCIPFENKLPINKPTNSDK